MPTTALRTEWPRSSAGNHAAGSRLWEVLADPDFHNVCAVSVLGLLLTFCFARAFSFDTGSLIALLS